MLYICLNGRFKCGNRACIEGHLVCDGVNSCGDDSDEVAAASGDICFNRGLCAALNKVVCPKSTSAVTATICIDPHQMCNGVVDCAGGTDEEFCHDCKENQFRCDHGATCLYAQSLCDFTADCQDGADEAFYDGMFCVPDGTMAQFGTGVPITNTGQTCEADRNNILSQNRCLDADTCAPVGRCIFRNQICNRYGPVNDFLGIPCLLCLGEFTCNDGSKCIPRSKLCNGVADCSDGSDEMLGNLCDFAGNNCVAGQVQCLETEAGGTNRDCYDPEDLCVLGSTCDETGRLFNTAFGGNGLDICGVTPCTTTEENLCGDGTCLKTHSGIVTAIVKCLCADDDAHPFNTGTGEVDFNKCENPKCNVDHCTTYNKWANATLEPTSTGVAKCIGSQSNKKCICKNGYFENSDLCSCRERKCNIDADCNEVGATLHRCVFVAGPEANEAKNKFCLCAPGYEEDENFECVLKDGVCEDGQCGYDGEYDSTAADDTLARTSFRNFGTCSGTTASFTCTCIPNYVNPLFPANNMVCEEKCDDSDCGIIIETMADGQLENNGPKATGLCTGTKSNFKCKCCEVTLLNVPTLTQNPNDGLGNIDETKCELPCMLMHCGGIERAHMCVGTITSFHCMCQPNHAISPTDNTYCYEVCNPMATAISTIQDICGDTAVSCFDGALETSDEFCVCAAGSVKKDGKCLGCLADLLGACGVGAKSCTGDSIKPKCQCALGYKLHQITGKCIEKHCNERANNPCVNGKCLNGYWSWSCKCDDGFFFNEIERQCLGCDVKACGTGYVKMELINYASSCAVKEGDQKTCECKEGFQVLSETEKQQECVRKHCENSQCAFSKYPLKFEGNNDFLTTDSFGTCYGDYIDFTCKCNHNFELVDGPFLKDTHPLVPQPKLCAPVDCSKSDKVLCDGNGYCIGYLQYYECKCYTGYQNSMSKSFSKQHCFEDTCHTGRLIYCGTGVTTCEFVAPDEGKAFWQKKIKCSCDTRGYTTNEDKSACIPIMCTSANAVEVCGEGATDCSGTFLAPICECDTKDNFYPDTKFSTCISPCHYNQEVLLQCGSSSVAACRGTYKKFVCLCFLPGYQVNPTNPQQCNEIPCDVGTNDMTPSQVAIHICGEGATACTGTWINPVCSCDASNNYIPKPNVVTSCIQNTCTYNEKAYRNCRIADGNTCSGTFDGYVCDCKTKGFRLSANGMTCEEISCNADDMFTAEELGVMACGRGALSCTGTIPNHVCQCDLTSFFYPGTLSQTCRKIDCNSNPTIKDACGGNTCVGPDNDYTCICTKVGWEYDMSNKQICKEIDCSTSTGVCGDGVVSCQGTVLSPVCECDITTHLPALDGKSCLLRADAECLSSEEAYENCKIAAGTGNTCKGTKANYICICQRYGYEHGEHSQQCVEVECKQENAVAVCGKGAIDCSGTLKSPVCQCDRSNNYISSSNTKVACIKEPCTNNPFAVARCGQGNICRGTFNEWECLCTAKGFTRLSTDKTACKEVYCDDSTDYVDVCGAGAIGCVGLVRSPACICDFAEGYVPNANGLSCIPAECRHNKVALQQCGTGNTCRGTFKSWACLCTAKGYETDLTDPKVCKQVYCNENTDATKICGEGATKCEGPINSPICYCDEDRDYVSTSSGTSCVIADCRRNPESKNCGPGNTCGGTVKSFQCICNARGYEIVPGNLRACQLIQCTAANAVEACGEGALDCSATFLRPNCVCDASRNFIAYEAGHRCLESDCRNNKEARVNCGTGNTCQGSFKSYQCICNAKGYTIDPLDPTRCVEVMCSEITDFVTVCGEGALGCEGSTRYPKCVCDNDQSFIASSNGQQCVLAGCQSNVEAQQRCGKGNGCIGTFKHYTCSCTSSGYEPDPNDVTSCVLRECNIDNAIRICGDGATDCSGSVLSPICSCETEGYTIAGNRHSCQPLPCGFNDKLNCLGTNTCSGTYFSATCNCAAPNYVIDKDTPNTCKPAACNYERCGGSALTGFFATQCFGFAIDAQCQCKEGYEGSGTSTCTPLGCSSNPAANCNDNGYCSGSYQSWTCTCNAPNYIRDPANSTRCLHRPCDINSCGVTARDGVRYNHASSCEGPDADRRCICNEGYTGTDTARCLPLQCDENPKANCNNHGQCRGNFAVWTCVCSGPDYIQDLTDPKSCIPAPCRRDQCGFSDITNSNSILYFAYDCEGTVLEPQCKCKDAYSGNGTPYCKIKYCDVDTDAIKVCGKGATKCEGPLNRPHCFCDESRDYVASSDGLRCVFSDCRSHPDYKLCGPGNPCRGSIESFQCICSATGWENVPGDLKSCRESMCDASNAVTICGTGALGCTGTYLKHQCICDVQNDYVSYNYNGNCYKATCRNSEMFNERCGEGNTCEGNIDSFHCRCSAKGYIYDPKDRTNCKRVMCDEVTDYSSICGEGATSCEGPINDAKCVCDNDNNYVASSNGKACIIASCYHNPEVLKRCGKGNGCTGTYKQFTCVCTSFGYEADAIDMTRCNLRECTYKDATRVCGDGATDCRGSVLSPTCSCDTDGYQVAGNRHTCQPLPCRFNKALDCGIGNVCSGTYFSATCACNGPTHIANKDDTQACLPAPCVKEECGQDISLGPDGLFAESCSGIYISPICNCKEGYSGSGTPYCTVKSCRDNPEAICGDGGKCDGTYFNWRCVCDRPQFIVDPHDSKKCIQAPCTKASCGFSTKLGAPYYFANGCEGSYTDRKCKCKIGFYGEGTEYCKPKSCRDNPEITCSGHGDCKGYYHEWTCVCNGPEYIQDPTDPKSCIEAPCKVEQCGKGVVQGYHKNYAESCTGSITHPTCICQKGFQLNDHGVCEAGDCNVNFKEICGNGASGCEGSVIKPICLCDVSRSFVASTDSTSCVVASCHSNPLSKQCGAGNSCKGSMKSFQCLCTADGWENDPHDDERCREVLCTKENVEKVCGTGSLDCKGTRNQPECICDTKNNYVTGENGKCSISDCNNNEEALKRCGPGNSCHGTLTSFQCICKAKGFILDKEDPTNCIEVMCEDIEDRNGYELVCSKGAIKCEGSTRNPICICDTKANYVPTEDGKECVLADCHSNPDIRDECGEGNGCIGTYKQFSCVCSAHGYTAHPTDLTKCVLEQCSSFNALQICGNGATNCKGDVLSPTCICDIEGYRQSPDLHSCQPLDCRFNKNLKCGEGNTCQGSYFSASCVCKEPASIVNMGDPYSCNDAPCKKEECGHVLKDGVPFYYAGGCSGSYLKRLCKCKYGYEGTGSAYCKPEECNDNPQANCGGFGRCKGSFDKWVCICDGPEYMLNPINSLDCIEAPCKVKQCGSGYINGVYQNFAKACEGSYINPTCYCRNEGFVLKDERCIIDPKCENHPNGLCNGGGVCNGDYFHFKCNCQRPEFEAVAGDVKTCTKALCDIEQCGMTTDENNNVNYHATKCYGTYLQPRCDCKKGYYINRDTGACVVAGCSVVHNVCDGKGDCHGDYFHYNCSCFDHHDHPNGNLQHCLPADCSSNIDVCAGNGICSGTFFVFGCNCYSGFQQMVYPSGQSTCVRASCSDDQCGGTSIAPYGSCGKGFYDEYNCTCKDNYAHPMLPDKTPIQTKCEVKCDKSHCGNEGVRECFGTSTEYYCVCEDDFVHARDSSDHPIQTFCEAKCKDMQCGASNGTTFGECSGTKSEFSCECRDGYSHPLSRDLEPMAEKCRPSCSDTQCGVSQEDEKEDPRQENSVDRPKTKPTEIKHGRCTGTLVSYTCTCKPGFRYAKDEYKNVISTTCEDINECEFHRDLCDENAKCVNTPGSYRCICKEKYVGMGTKQQGCYLNGGWGVWKHEECSRSCGGGTTSKYRECLVRDVSNHTTNGNKTTNDMMEGLCEGESLIDHIPCNLFDCEGLCMKTKCGCKMVRQFSKGNVPSNDLHYFDYVQKYDFDQMTGKVEKVAVMAQQDLCKVDRYGSKEDIKKLVNDEIHGIQIMLEKLKRAKIEMRNYINCNENALLREIMFSTYKTLSSHMIMTSFIRNDLEVEQKIINKKLGTCQNNSKHMMFGDLMDVMLEARD